MIDAVVLAGRPNTGALREAGAVPWEALIEIAGRPMAAHVVAALRQAAGVGRVVVVGPEALGPAVGPDVTLVAPGGSLVENLRRGLAAAGAGVALSADGRTPGVAPPAGGVPRGGAVLLVGGDVPLLTGPMIDAFLAACEAVPASLHYPIIPRAECMARSPGARRTFVTVREGAFTGGNLFRVDSAAAPGLLDLAERFYAARKSPLRLAGLLGWGTVVKFLLKRAGIPELEAVVARLAGVPARAVIVADPEIGMDVDKPEDLKLAEAVLSGGGRGTGRR